MLKKLLFLNIALMCCQLVTVQAQSISPKVISSAGSTATGGSSIINYNIGEPVIGTLTGGSYQITQGFEQPGGVNSTLLTGIISYWKLDDTTGTVAVDATGAYNGTNTADSLKVTGKIKTAYGFNGTASKIDMANTTSSLLSLTTSGTISAWVLVPVIHAGDLNSYYSGAIVSKGDFSNDQNGYSLIYSSYENVFTGELASATGHTSFNFNGPTIAANTWYHLVVTWSGGTITTYMNAGTPLTYIGAVTPASSVYPFAIGYQASHNNYYWRGRIDEVGIWNRALTAKEDSLLYAAGYGNQYPFDGSGNVLPTANAGANQTLSPNTTSTTLNGSGTGTAITYAWTKTSGGSATITTPSAASTTITGLTAGAYSFQLAVTDNLGNTASSIVNVTVNPVPTANAGSNQSLAPGTTSTTLNGSGTGSGLTYAWTQTAGAGASITSPTAASTGITGLTTGTYTFLLTVTDNSTPTHFTATSSVNVTVNALPTANAGTNQTLVQGTTSTTLVGTGTGAGITYAWTQTAGPGTATITAPTAASTTVTALTTGTYTFLLTVSDNATPTHNTATSSVNVTILSAGGSSLLTGLISYWNLDETSGTIAFDNAGGGNNGTNTADTTGVTGKINTAYGFNGTTSKIDVTNSNTNLNLAATGSISAWVLVPVIHSGDLNSYYSGGIVSKGDFSNDLNGYTLTYSSYANAFTGELASATGHTSFNFNGPTIAANTWYHLVVTWSGGTITTYMNAGTPLTYTGAVTPASSVYPFAIGYQASHNNLYWRGRIDEVGIWNRALTSGEVSTLYNSNSGYGYPFNGYLPPTANAGTNQSLQGGTTSTTLNGSGTGSGITYAWTQTAGPGGATITTPTSASTSVTGLAAGTYTFLLTVTDNHTPTPNTATSSVNVTVSALPTANAGSNQTFVPGTTSTTLYGSGTGTGITYAWTQTAGPGTATITAPAAASTTVTALTTGTYTFLLTVSDNATPTPNTATSSVNVTIQSTGGSSLITGLISYWNLDEPSGNIAFDNAGGGNNGTNTADTLGVTGKINTAYGFNGTTSKIDVTNSNTNLNLAATGSISAWVLIPVIHAGDLNSYYSGAIVSKGDFSNDLNGYTLTYSSYANAFTGELASATGHTGFNFNGPTIVANTWYHLVVTWTGGTITTYMNAGTPTTYTGAVTPASSVYPFAIGYQASHNNLYWRGRIDEVGIWNRALTSGEVSTLYNSNSGYGYPFNGYLPPTANAGTNQSLQGGTTSATLNGSGTGSGITYAWTQTAGPGGATITTPTSASTSVTGLAAGTYTFLLTVTDNHTPTPNTATSSVNVTVSALPTANAGSNQTFVPGTTSTTLYGSGTGTGITYAWTQTAGPGTATITAPAAASTTVTALTTGTYTFLLTVSDNATPTPNTATSSVNVTIQSTGGSSLITGLISYWNLDEPSGNIAFDNAGGGNNGTNTADTVGVTGKLNTAYGFNGTTSKIDVTNSNTNLNLAGSGSISAWVLIPVIHAGDLNSYYSGAIVSKGDFSNDLNGYSLIYSSYENVFTGELASATGHTSFNFNGPTIAANTWYHLVVTWSGGTITTYMNDGTPLTFGSAVTPASSVYPFAIGYQASHNNYYWRGRIDEVGIWNRALTKPGVDSLYNSGLGYPYPFAPQGGLPVGITSAPTQPLVTNDANTSVTAYPNPYSTEIHFNMKTQVSGKASLVLYDLLGRKVATVFEGDLAAGFDKTVSYQPNIGKRQPLIYIFTIGDKVIQGKLIPGEY
jgi:hypothetical protein